ncbi:MAG: hypothetical protein MJ120_00100 [Clostridia bacterium]|nr:hypothetical protein [Clostridia bacterium]
MAIGEKRQKAGDMLIIDYYPVFDNGNKKPIRAAKEKRSTDEQIRYNRAQATRKLIMLVNANFSNEDFYLHLTFSAENEPADERCARKEISNFFRRVKRYRNRQLDVAETLYKEICEEAKAYPNSKTIQKRREELKSKIKELKADFKYIYCVEKKNKWHFHLFMTGAGIEKKEIEQFWGKGFVRNNKYKPETFGPEAAAAYMAKDPKGSKSFAHSLNLKKPKTKKKIANFKHKKHFELATKRCDDKKYWENKFKGYRFLRCNSRLNPYNNCYYITLVMFRTDVDPVRFDIFDDDYLSNDDYIVEAY